jgi:hypothetical protein
MTFRRLVAAEHRRLGSPYISVCQLRATFNTSYLAFGITRWSIRYPSHRPRPLESFDIPVSNYFQGSIKPPTACRLYVDFADTVAKEYPGPPPSAIMTTSGYKCLTVGLYF